MATTHILLICATGMSTNMLVSKMKKAAKEKSEDVKITAVSANEADSHLTTEEIDILLLGPQVRYMKSKFLKNIQGRNTPVEVINIRDYGMMNGEKILNDALNVTKNSIV